MPADSKLVEATQQAFRSLCKEVRETRQLEKFFEVLLGPGYPSGDHPLDHMLLGQKAKQHFPGVDMRDPKQVQDILHSFFRRFLDREANPPVTSPGKDIYFGKFSHGRLKGQVFKFWTNKGETGLRAGFVVTTEDAKKAISGELKDYCHRVGDASYAGSLSGGLAAGLGAYAFEQLYRKICAECNHEISRVEDVAMKVGKLVASPAGAIVGQSAAEYIAGFQCVSMLGPMKFQACSILAGAAAGVLVGIAVMGVTTAIGTSIRLLMNETEKCMELARVAGERRKELESLREHMAEHFASRLQKIASDIDATERLLKQASQACASGLRSEEEVVSWMGVGHLAKFGLEQILKALDQLENDCKQASEECLKRLRKAIADASDGVMSQMEGDTARSSIMVGTLPWLFLGPPGWLLAGVTNLISSAVYQTRTRCRMERIDEHAKEAVQGKVAFLTAKLATLACGEQREKASALLKEVQDLQSQWAAELNKQMQSCVKPAKAKEVPSQEEPEEPSVRASWLVENLIPAY